MKSLCLILILAISATTGCSRSSSASRQERAYAKYLKKSKGERAKRQAAFRNEKWKLPETFPPQEITQVSHSSEGPQAGSGDSPGE